MHSSAAREEGGENRLNCEYITLSRQTSSTRIAKHRSFIKLKFLQNFCSSCKTLADQVARNPRFYCKKKSHRAKSGLYGGWGSLVILFRAKNSHTLDKFFGTSFEQIFLMCRSSIMIWWTSVFGSPTSSAINHTLKRRSLSRTAFPQATLFSVLEVQGRLAHCSSSTLSLLSLNALCHLKTWDEDKTASP